MGAFITKCFGFLDSTFFGMGLYTDGLFLHWVVGSGLSLFHLNTLLTTFLCIVSLYVVYLGKFLCGIRANLGRTLCGIRRC